MHLSCNHHTRIKVDLTNVEIGMYQVTAEMLLRHQAEVGSTSGYAPAGEASAADLPLLADLQQYTGIVGRHRNRKQAQQFDQAEPTSIPSTSTARNLHATKTNKHASNERNI